jgi:hypothetical protein
MGRRPEGGGLGFEQTLGFILVAKAETAVIESPLHEIPSADIDQWIGAVTASRLMAFSQGFLGKRPLWGERFNMKKGVILMAMLGTLSASGPAAASSAAQRACLDAAMERYHEVQKVNEENFRKDLEPCDVSGSGEFADRCYLRAARRYQSASQRAQQAYDAESRAFGR